MIWLFALIACGNDFWLKRSPEKLSEFVRMPIDSVEKIKLSSVEGLKIPYKVESYQLRHLIVDLLAIV